MSKLKGSRLETEVDKVRTDGNWKRLSELLPSVKSKNSGLEDCHDLFQGEIILETFLEQLGDVLRPHKDNYEKLRVAETHFTSVIKEKPENTSVFMEASILLAKVYYTCVEYVKAINLIDSSGMEKGSNPFRTLRALRLVAEGYAIKGLCLESIEEKDYKVQRSNSNNSISSISNEQKAVYCFEKSAELAMSYINELEKTLSTGSSSKLGNSSTGNLMQLNSSNNLGTKPQEKIGEILERCLERVAVIRAKDTVAQRRAGSEGIEWYRKIISCLGDKSTGERLQQKLSRQLAEILIRAPVANEDRSISEAMNMKSQNLNFYTGSNHGYYAPSSRTEEIILLLLISEVLSTREVVLSRSEDLSNSRVQSLKNAKSVYNLLSLVLTTLRQYHVLASIYERAMKFANNDSYIWQQFALASICRGRFQRAARVLQQSIMNSSPSADIKSSEATNGTVRNEVFNLTNNPSCSLSGVTEYLLLCQIFIEKFGDYKSAIIYSKKAMEICTKDNQLMFLKARCQLMYAIANGLSALNEISWTKRKSELAKAVNLAEECVASDPHDYLALYYAAFFHAIARDLDAAKDRCSRSLALNSDQPAAVMLLGLIFTAFGDLKGALELVVKALDEFANNYGLLVLKLHIETKFGRIEQSLDTCTHLLDFWKKRDAFTVFGCTNNNDDEKSQVTFTGLDGGSILNMREGSVKAGTPSLGTELSTPLVPGSPMLTLLTNSSSGIEASCKMERVLDVYALIGESVMSASENGGQSTSSDIYPNGTSSDSWSKFRSQADIWMSLAELFLAEGREADVTKCVEQAVSLYPCSPQAMYLKGRLLASRAGKLTDEGMLAKIRGEAKSAYLSALALCTNHSPSMSAMAKLYSDEGNHKMAEHMLREMVRDDPLNCEWWQMLGCSFLRRDEADKAVECFNAAAQLDRSTPLLPFTVLPPVFPSNF